MELNELNKLNVDIHKQEDNKMSVLDCEFHVPFHLHKNISSVVLTSAWWIKSKQTLMYFFVA